MPASRTHSPFTDKQLEAFATGKLTGRELRLLATIEQFKRLANEARDKNHGGRVDELAREVERLRRQLERLTEERAHYRVLAIATKDETIEVYADPQVRVQVACLPETRTTEGYERALQWAVGKLPSDFNGMVNDCEIRPELHSVRCMSRAEWDLYRLRMEEIGYLEQFLATVETIPDQTQEQQASEVGAGAPPATDDIPW